jgi:hypothetical protein
VRVFYFKYKEYEMANFFEDYKRPEWQKFRLAVFEHNLYTCQYCGEKTKQLHAHHFFYRKGAKPWEYDVREVHCLCEECHKEQHTKRDDTPIEMLLSSIAKDGKCPMNSMDVYEIGSLIVKNSSVGVFHILGSLLDEKLSKEIFGMIKKKASEYKFMPRGDRSIW